VVIALLAPPANAKRVAHALLAEDSLAPPTTMAQTLEVK
jgi:hypothetical protein